MGETTPPSLTALGGKPLPGTIEAAGKQYALQKVFKNDFFAVTALYEGSAGKVILKVQRQASFFGVPLRWAGRLLAAREWRALQRLADLDGIPRPICFRGTTGVGREYVEGRPMRRGEPVPDDFHERLRRLIVAIHQRGMAYVDLEKCENVLVGDDGKPHLFDFQIAWYVPSRWGGDLWPLRAIRRWLQKGDLYHLTKLQRRTRPDQLTDQERAASYRRPWFVRAHRVVTKPFTAIRRAILERVDPRRGRGERGRVANDVET